MLVTVLWEDQRGTQARGFGPHELLLSCLADELAIPREVLRDHVSSHPKKGVGNVRSALRRDLERLTKSGPVLAVVDWDQVHDLWKDAKPRPPRCKTGLTDRMRQDAPGDYELVFFEQNIETLIHAVCRATGRDVPTSKPKPDLRDRILARVVWHETEHKRREIRDACPSFDRIVAKTAARLRPVLPHP